MTFENYKAGTVEPDDPNRAFVPTTVNEVWTWADPRITTLLEEARGALGELNAYSFSIDEIDRFITMHVVVEATESSRIEGTRTGLDEALRPIEEIDPERRDDWQEVQNYIRAMNDAVAGLEKLPLSNRLLKGAHATLMEGVRGTNKDPGEWRRSQNWIGGASPRDAIYVPPPHYKVGELMSDLERFWHNDAIEVPDLIRVAISHYQFESIHPFLDGNGRIGRLLIPLYLIDKKLLAKPSLYLSSYLERHKADYYDALTAVRERDDLAGWVRFFLIALRESARNGCRRMRAIMELRKTCEAGVRGLGQRAEKGLTLLDYLYKQPVVSLSLVAALLKVSHTTAGGLVNAFETLGILEELTGQRRNRLYSFEAYYRLFEEVRSSGEM